MADPRQRGHQRHEPVAARAFRRGSDRISERFRKEQRDRWLPPIIATVISQDPGGWTTARSLEDMLDPRVMAIPGMAPLVPQSSLVIDDLSRLSDDALAARMLAPYPTLALWLLRDAHDPARLLCSFDTWRRAMLEVLESPDGRDRFTTLVRYMFHVVDPIHHNKLRVRLYQLGPRAKGVIMSIAEYLEEKGRKKGERMGRKKGRVEGRKEGRAGALRDQLLFKFKLPTLDAIYETRLNTLTPEAIRRCLQRVLVADSIAAVFESES